MKLFSFLVLFTTQFWNGQGLPLVDLAKYTGRWYQTFANPFSFYFTENAGSCIYADYTAVDESTIRIFNGEKVKDKSQSIKGTASVVNLEEPAKLTVKFDGLPFNGTYWIYDIGPIENNQYQYSIVSDDTKSSLFVLTRNLEVFSTLYESKVKESLEHLGFSNQNLIPTIQTNCSYP